MQVLIFHIGDDAYGLPTARVERVLPLLHVKAIPGTPPWVAGVADYHGAPVPLIDISLLATGQAAAACLDTRIVLAHYVRPQVEGSGSADFASGLLGLLVERVTGLQDIDEQTLRDAGIAGPPWLGKVASGHRMLQLVDLDHLLPASVHALLFPSEQAC